jgi:hypothetical protein
MIHAMLMFVLLSFCVGLINQNDFGMLSIGWLIAGLAVKGKKQSPDVCAVECGSQSMGNLG